MSRRMARTHKWWQTGLSFAWVSLTACIPAAAQEPVPGTAPYLNPALPVEQRVGDLSPASHLSVTPHVSPAQ